MGAGEVREGGSPPGVKPGAVTALLEELAQMPGEPGVALPAFHPGQVVGRFELLRELGRGGFGVVWEARDRELDRKVAFKAVRAGSHAALKEERLLREAEAAAQLSHPNIVTLFEVGHSERGPYLVLELLEGRTLAGALGEGPLPAREAVRIAVEVAKGLSHAHAHGVVHRDLTPANVFLCDDGRVKILDFGLAHAFGRRRQEGGTPAYMAPEQAAGAPEDERTDVFALGVMLFESLSGRLPFTGARALRSRGPAPALETPGAPGLAVLVGRMLEREPLRRPRDGSEVLRALGAEQRELEGSVPASAPVRVRRRLARRSMGIGAGVALVATGALVASLVLGRRPPPAREGGVPTVAVLPFTDMSSGKDQEYLGDGIAEEIINALTRVEGLQVVGRTSSFSFKGKAVDLREVGRRVGAGAVLEGSVRKAASKVRITAQLVNAANGYHLWSETYDREVTDVLALEDDIARAVVEALRVRLGAGSPVAPRSRRAVAPAVYTSYLIGKQLAHQASWARSAQAFEQALQVDGGYAPAWAGLAFATFWVTDVLGKGAEIRKGQDRAMAAADRAVALDPELGDAYSVRGFLRMVLRCDWEGARSDLERALRLNPGDADAHRLYGIHTLNTRGPVPEAMAEMARATELDPLNALAWSTYGRAWTAAGQLERALKALDRAVEIAPEIGYAPAYKAVALVLLGRPAEAAAWAERSTLPAYRLMAMAIAAEALGREEESRRLLDELIAWGADGAAYQIAQVYAWRGEREKAFEWLERAYRQRDAGLVTLRSDRLMRDLRGDPRFGAVLREIGLPPL